MHPTKPIHKFKSLSSATIAYYSGTLPVAMHKAIIHIGTEKTGSTSIQNFLFKNGKALLKSNIFFPYTSCGAISNYRLVSYALTTPDRGLSSIDKHMKHLLTAEDTESAFEQWKAEFVSSHASELASLREGLTSSTIVYSSEHFHSRTQKLEEIQRLKDLLTPLYDQIDIVVYLRRQDSLVISAVNTAIQGGQKRLSYFENFSNVRYYFNYQALLTRWADVFGIENVHPNVFDKSVMHGGSVIEDFAHRYLGVSSDGEKLTSQQDGDAQSEQPNHNVSNKPKPTQRNKNKKSSHRQHSNERLSYTALCTLVEFNNLTDDSPLLKKHKKESVRKELINKLHHVEDDYGELLPSRQSALDFYSLYKAGNDAVSEKWADFKGFSDDFSKYPTQADTFPSIDVKPVLEKTIAAVITDAAK